MSRKFRAFIAVVVVVLAVPAWMVARAGRNPKQQANSAENQALKVDVDLVLVYATVTDPLNRYVSGLGAEHFQVWEDKVEQKIEYFSSEDVPMSLGMIFDVSGSMKDKIGTARDAAVTFLKTGNPEDEYFLVEFANRP